MSSNHQETSSLPHLADLSDSDGPVNYDDLSQGQQQTQVPLSLDTITEVMKNASSFDLEEETKDHPVADTEEEDETVRELEICLLVTKENEEDELIIDDFITVKEKIGQGRFCAVKKAVAYYKEEDLTVNYALKIYRRSELKGIGHNAGAGDLKMVTQFDCVMKELQLWARIVHPNIVKVFRLYKAPEQEKLYVWMQLADLGQIAYWNEQQKKYILNPKVGERVATKFATAGTPEEQKEKIVSFIFRGVTNGLDYLHNTMNMANRDIKPDNILFATIENGTNNTHEDRAQIADFTTVVECIGEDFKVTGEDGTKAFMPPECFDSGREYSPKPVDIWSIGVSIYVTLFEAFPFDISSEDQLIGDIKKKQIDIPFGSECLQDVLKCTLERDPAKRVTIAGLLGMDWFTQKL